MKNTGSIPMFFLKHLLSFFILMRHWLRFGYLPLLTSFVLFGCAHSKGQNIYFFPKAGNFHVKLETDLNPCSINRITEMMIDDSFKYMVIEDPITGAKFRFHMIRMQESLINL